MRINLWICLAIIGVSACKLTNPSSGKKDSIFLPFVANGKAMTVAELRQRRLEENIIDVNPHGVTGCYQSPQDDGNLNLQTWHALLKYHAARMLLENYRDTAEYLAFGSEINEDSLKNISAIKRYVAQYNDGNPVRKSIAKLIDLETIYKDYQQNFAEQPSDVQISEKINKIVGSALSATHKLLPVRNRRTALLVNSNMTQINDAVYFQLFNQHPYLAQVTSTGILHNYQFFDELASFLQNKFFDSQPFRDSGMDAASFFAETLEDGTYGWLYKETYSGNTSPFIKQEILTRNRLWLDFFEQNRDALIAEILPFFKNKLLTVVIPEIRVNIGNAIATLATANQDSSFRGLIAKENVRAAVVANHSYLYGEGQVLGQSCANSPDEGWGQSILFIGGTVAVIGLALLNPMLGVVASLVMSAIGVQQVFVAHEKIVNLQSQFAVGLKEQGIADFRSIDTALHEYNINLLMTAVDIATSWDEVEKVAAAVGRKIGKKVGTYFLSDVKNGIDTVLRELPEGAPEKILLGFSEHPARLNFFQLPILCKSVNLSLVQVSSQEALNNVYHDAVYTARNLCWDVGFKVADFGDLNWNREDLVVGQGAFSRAIKVELNGEWKVYKARFSLDDSIVFNPMDHASGYDDLVAELGNMTPETALEMARTVRSGRFAQIKEDVAEVILTVLDSKKFESEGLTYRHTFPDGSVSPDGPTPIAPKIYGIVRNRFNVPAGHIEELIDGRTLDWHINSARDINLQQFDDIMNQLREQTNILHSKFDENGGMYYHGDIHQGNILLVRRGNYFEVRLIDFSTFFGAYAQHETNVTALYLDEMAVESMDALRVRIQR